jgi:hypothetical protein
MSTYAWDAMDADHDRYATLAVGHALGGLSGSDARRFRSHLQGCAACRTRVAELRGIAEDLAAAEEDERSRVALRTDSDAGDPDRDPEHGDEHDRSAREVEAAPTWRLTVGHVTAAAVVVLVIAVGVLFWNLHLRTTVAGYDQLLDVQTEALRTLARGTELSTDLAPGVTGVVATDDERIVITLSGIEAREGQTVSAWTVDAEGQMTEETRAAGTLLREGSFAVVIDRAGVVEVLVTLEDGVPGDDPGGQALVRAEL